jgi:hypothetical protein
VKPKVFIGASVESGRIVDALLVGLDHDARCIPWYNAFPTGPNAIDSLIQALRECDFGVFIFAPDDATRMRDKDYLIARDNVVFEAGLFMGMHAKDRTFIIAPRDLPSFHLASDFLGITTANYDPQYSREDELNAYAPTAARIRQSINRVTQSTVGVEIKSRSSLAAAGSGLTFPLKLHLEFTNTQNTPAFIESKGFTFGPHLRSSPKAKLTADGRYEFQFYKGVDPKDPKKEIWEQSILLEPGKTSTSWIPFDETIPKAEVDQRIANRQTGKLKYRLIWHSTPPTAQEVEDPI